MHHSEARRLKGILTVQAALGVVMAISALGLGLTHALSASIGVAASLVGNLVSALWVFHDYRAQEPERITMRLYIAEVAKITVVVAIVATALATFNGLSAPILLGAFLVAQVVAPVVAAQLDTPPSRGSGERKQK